MADCKILAIHCLLLVLFLSHLALIEGKGRGGGGRGRIGRVRPSGGGRGRVTPIRSRPRAYSRPWFQKPIFVGTLYGLAAYKTRRRFRDHPNSEPRTCRNFVAPNGTHYGYFICPQWHQSNDFSYCCGPEKGQRCCRFADDPSRLAGVVIGGIISVVFMALIIALCCWCRKRQGTKKPGTGRVLKGPTASANNGYNPGTGATYGVPAKSGQTPYPVAPGEMPYPVAPGDTPHPVAPSETPYPVRPVDHDFNPGTGATYGPPDSDAPPPIYPGGEPPYPAPVYPPAPGGPVYPPAYHADGAMYPPAEPPTGYPNAPSDGPPYPTESVSAPYPIK
ncbi:uncharacterized protein LOC135499880 isoform X2 [Lineus longissimus]|uniref:uncharacterized protein LOC135499880 isoform X2 n=1 Tax=Lineus longissimus TaxID=88925 RepID=UPI002B4CA07B